MPQITGSRAFRREFLREARDCITDSGNRTHLEARFAEIAVANGIGGFLEKTVSRQAAMYRRNCQLEVTASLISESLSNDNVHHAVVRGPVSASLYPDPSRRSYADLDFYIRYEEAARASRVLERIGFKQGTVENGKFREINLQERRLEGKEKRLHAFIAPLQENGGAYAVVEVHHSLFPGYSSESETRADQLLSSVTSDKTPLTGSDILVLGPVERAVELCIHIQSKITHLAALRARRDLTFGLYADLHLLMRKAKVDETTLIEASSRLNIKDQVLLAIEATHSAIHGFALEREIPVKYVLKTKCYEVVGRIEVPFDDRFCNGASTDGLRWTVHPSEFDDGAVLHPHVRGA